jgi:hypothetical protein
MISKGRVFEILEKYTPRFWNSPNYRTNMLMTIILNRDFGQDLVAYVDWSEQNDIDDTDITTTIMHDIGGMMKSDNLDFLPRCSGYSTQTINN